MLQWEPTSVFPFVFTFPWEHVFVFVFLLPLSLSSFCVLSHIPHSYPPSLISLFHFRLVWERWPEASLNPRGFKRTAVDNYQQHEGSRSWWCFFFFTHATLNVSAGWVQISGTSLGHYIKPLMPIMHCTELYYLNLKMN